VKTGIVITGVGGQGVVTASRLLASAAMDAGLPVCTSEVIGMAQREGAVMSQVRIGQRWGATIPAGEADVLLGLELAETVRGLPKLKPGGSIVARTTVVVPVTATLGLSRYDREEFLTCLGSLPEPVFLLEAAAVALRAGNARAENVVMLGALARLSVLPFSADHLHQILLGHFPERNRRQNSLAFQLGGAQLDRVNEGRPTGGLRQDSV
jgi:indolepyruvate ferredoxin oxidoreductase beta subunit